MPVRPIARIDDVGFAVDADLMLRLHACHDSAPLEFP
jgi:hypothetical protein